MLRNLKGIEDDDLESELSEETLVEQQSRSGFIFILRCFSVFCLALQPLPPPLVLWKLKKGWDGLISSTREARPYPAPLLILQGHSNLYSLYYLKWKYYSLFFNFFKNEGGGISLEGPGSSLVANQNAFNCPYWRDGL